MDATRLLLVVVAAAIGGAINAIAGGGTLVTFPALVGLGVPAISANATSTVALWPCHRRCWFGTNAGVKPGPFACVPDYCGPPAAADAATPGERFEKISPGSCRATLLFASGHHAALRKRGATASVPPGNSPAQPAISCSIRRSRVPDTSAPGSESDDGSARVHGLHCPNTHR